MYMDGTTIPDTPERQAMEELGCNRYCCRMKLMTNTDLNEKV
jgi:DNA-directed RNA polymerase subunit N (RpoN/RPB10)